MPCGMKIMQRMSSMPYIVLAAPMKLVPNHTRSPSVNDSVSSEPTVAPSSEYTPPAMTANTICSDTAMPDPVSGLRYMKYWPAAAAEFFRSVLREVFIAFLPGYGGHFCLLFRRVLYGPECQRRNRPASVFLRAGTKS